MSNHPHTPYHILEQVPAGYYEEGVKHNPFQRIWHGRKWRMLDRLLAPDRALRHGAVLDVGCATGLTTSHLASWFPQARTVGLDAYDAALAYGRRHHPGVCFTLGDAHRLPFASERFDAAICVETLEHLPDPRACVREIWRCLKPGATFILAQDTNSLLFRAVWWAWTRVRRLVWDHAHVSPLDENGLAALLEESGFRILERRYTFFGMEVFFRAEKAARAY